MAKYVYFFSAGKSDGDGSMKNVRRQGCEPGRHASSLPVPGFTSQPRPVPSIASGKEKLFKTIEAEVKTQLTVCSRRRKDLGKVPTLLVSVRSGAAASMPGMMDGSQPRSQHETVKAMIDPTKRALCTDAYRRFIQMPGDVVMVFPPRTSMHLTRSKRPAARNSTTS